MTPTLSEDTTTVVDALSRLTFRHLNSLAAERSYPVSDVDASDEKMARCKVTVLALRRIRNEFEDLMTGALL